MGVILGHSFCTGLAVVGGKFLAERISVKTGINSF
jgi:putative Ca2+/H+ antiporter (TMEM165/GDT1 family)